MTRILVVDDDEQNVYMLQVLLEGHGHTVVAAKEGAEALETARRDPPDMIVSDILMPVMDGFRLCREWKKDQALMGIPFVFYTATYTDPKDEEFALSLGADRFIAKPAEPDVLVEVVRQVMEEYEMGRPIVPRDPVPEEAVYFREYNEALIRKLEDKMVQLEQANRALQRDVAEQVRAEKERERLLVQIRQQAQRMQEIMATVPEGMLLLDSSGQVVMANRVAKGYLGTLAGAEIGDELTHLGGRPIAELLTSPPTKGMWHEVAADGPVFEVIARPVEDGPEPTGWVLVIRDVTREREIHQQAQQQERLAAVGQLAAGIAHDFNNIMAVIVLYAQLMQRGPDLPPEARERLKIIDRQAKHATGLIDQILDFSRRSVLERRPLDLEVLVKEQVKLLERTLPENVRVSLACGEDEYTARADLTRMQQVTLNLALNARDAMLPAGGGELRISLSRMAEAEETECSTCGQVVAGRDGWVRLEVADSGTGISKEALPHIFEPFYTTKERGKGTGLGLAQVYGIVVQHEGHIDVATRPGEGTTFTVYLPALLVPGPSESADWSTHNLPQGRGETILVVEDNPELRSALVASLAGLNYRTLEAPDGREALEVFAEHAGAPSAGSGPGIALVLSDLVMPVMGGRALFRALRQRDPAVKVVLLTGHPMEEELEELAEQGLNGWLFKPANLEKLAQLLERVLRDG